MKEKIEDFFYSDSPYATATKFLLAFFAVGSVAFGGAILPGILRAMKGFDFKKEKNEFSKKEFANALSTLKRQKFIKIVAYDEDKVKIELTNKGEKRLTDYSIDLLEIKKPARWDNKWRILMFDIPTKPKIYNQAREALRAKIKELGFYQMQKSVWVYPYDCEDQLLFIAEIFGVERHVEIITADRILHGKTLERKFKLIRPVGI